MSDSFWKKLNHIAGFLLIGIVFALTAFAATVEIKDLDLWLHIRTGQYLVEHRTIPDHDVLSCTISGKPWVNHEWLFQVIAYTVHHRWGFEGLQTMQSVVVCLTFMALLFISYRRDRQGLIGVMLLLVLMVYQNRFTIRPDIFSLFFFALDMYILSLHIDKRWCIFALGVIQVLWVNMHGFFFFGPLLVLIAIAAELTKRYVLLPYEWNRIGRLTEVEYKRLWAIFGVILCACLINPMGVKGAVYPLKVLFDASGDSKIFFKHIMELKPPFEKGLFGDIYADLQYKVLIIISTLSFVYNRRKIDISVLFVWLAFLLFSLVAIRNLVFFACAAYLVTLVNSMTIKSENILPLRFSNAKFKDITAIMIKCALIWWTLNYSIGLADRGYFDFKTYERKSEFEGVSLRPFPTQAVDFLTALKIKGNFFNDFNSGAYLIGRTHPDIKVFIDGRTEVYGGKFFLDYQKIWTEGDKKTLEDAIKKYHLTGALLNGANQNIPVKIVRSFYGFKDWKLVYFDHDGMVFLKNTPENLPVIARYAIDLKKWEPLSMDLQRLGPKRILPFPFTDRAKVLMALKLDGPAMKELNEAQLIAPDMTEIYEMKGDIYGHQKNYVKAFKNFRIAAMYDHKRENLMRLAWAYDKLGNLSQALVFNERLLEKNPGDDKIKAKIKALKGRMKVKN